MTFDEHTARAAIMDRMFDWRDGTYVHNLELGDYVDCTTLEPVTFEECKERMSREGTKHATLGMGREDYDYWCRVNPELTLPWITSGGNDDG